MKNLLLPLHRILLFRKYFKLSWEQASDFLTFSLFENPLCRKDSDSDIRLLPLLHPEQQILSHNFVASSSQTSYRAHDKHLNNDQVKLIFCPVKYLPPVPFKNYFQ